MTTYLLNLNPKRWEWDDLEEEIARLHDHGWVESTWSCGVTKKIQVGDRFFLIRLGREPRGIVGSGAFRSSPFEELHWDAEMANQGFAARFVEVIFDGLVNADFDAMLPMSFLKTHPVLSQMHWSQQASGVRIPDEIATELVVHWSSLFDISAAEFDENSGEEPVFEEGSLRTVTLTRYERNRAARKKCLDHFGLQCVVCDFDFEATYGEAGTGYIHVHHMVPLSEIGEAYEVDPIRDLRPVCPNCHAVIHRRKPPYSLNEIRSFIGIAESHS